MITKKLSFFEKNATYVIVNTIELSQLIEKVQKINRFNLFIPFSLLDQNGLRYVCA